MGTDPDNTDYEPGVDCPNCNATLFGGVTPKYVEADVFGVIACPGAPAPPPDGVYLLVQQVAPCQWIYVEPFYTFTWFLGPATSAFSITLGPNFWFGDLIMATCKDVFNNTRVCGAPFSIGASGSVSLWWGPTIGP